MHVLLGDSRGRARAARRVQGARAGAAREPAPARPPDARRRTARDRRAGRAIRRARTGGATAHRSSPTLVDAVLDGVAPARSFRRPRGRGVASRPPRRSADRDAVPPGRHAATVGGRARGGLAMCCGSQTLERLGGPGRIVEEHLERALDALTPAQKELAARMFNHLVTPSGHEDRARDARPGRLRRRRRSRARPVLLDARTRADPAARGGTAPSRVRDLPRRPRRRRARRGARFEASAALEREREAARRRHRRLLIIVVAAALALAVMGATRVRAVAANEAQKNEAGGDRRHCNRRSTRLTPRMPVPRRRRLRRPSRSEAAEKATAAAKNAEEQKARADQASRRRPTRRRRRPQAPRSRRSSNGEARRSQKEKTSEQNAQQREKATAQDDSASGNKCRGKASGAVRTASRKTKTTPRHAEVREKAAARLRSPTQRRTESQAALGSAPEYSLRLARRLPCSIPRCPSSSPPSAGPYSPLVSWPS